MVCHTNGHPHNWKINILSKSDGFWGRCLRSSSDELQNNRFLKLKKGDIMMITFSHVVYLVEKNCVASK